MKVPTLLPFAVPLVLLALGGCGPTKGQVNRVIAVGTEIAKLQDEFYPAATEMGRVAVQLEMLRDGKTPAAAKLSGEITEALKLVEEAFEAAKKANANYLNRPQEGVEKYIEHEETTRSYLQEAVAKTKAAVSKSRAILQEYSKIVAAGPKRKK